MQATSYKYIHFLPFSSFSFWDAKRLLFNENIESQYKFIKLGTIITPIYEKIKKDDYKGNMKVVAKVSFDEGKIYLREKNETGMDLYKLYDGDLLVSNINFHQGAISINNFGEDLVCSTHYQPYSIDKSIIHKEFLVLVLRSESYKNYIINQKSNGIKTESKYNFIKDLEIPLPSLTEQQRIVDRYHELMSLAQTQAQQAEQKKQEIESYLMEELGIEFTENKTEKGKLFFVESKILERWDVWNNQNGFISKEKVLNFGELIIGKPMYGANTKGVDRVTDVRYIRITDINEDGSLNDDIISAEVVEERYLLKENDFLIARSGNTVGKTFLYKNHHGECLFAGYLVKYQINTEQIIPEYMFIYTKSLPFKQRISSKQRVAGQPNINGQEYLSAPVILPSKEKQKRIIEKYQLLRADIQNLKFQSQKNQARALTEFEQEIFS